MDGIRYEVDPAAEHPTGCRLSRSSIGEIAARAHADRWRAAPVGAMTDALRSSLGLPALVALVLVGLGDLFR
jgi:hypothetical protein